MFGKAVETLKFQTAIEPQAPTSAGTYYNGAAAGSNTFIDTRGYDGLTVRLQAGVFSGDGTVAASLVASNDDDPANAVAITGADFTAITSENDQATQTGHVKCSGQARYHWVRTVKGGTGAALHSAEAILDNGQSLPQSNSPVFDVDGAV